MANKPIVVELTKEANGFPKGAELGFASEAKATSTLGEDTFRVVRHQDMTPVDAPKASTTATSATKDGKKG